MKNNRAPGVSGIPAELLKYGGTATLLWLQVLFSIVFRAEWIPKDWRAWNGELGKDRNGFQRLDIILPLWKRKDSRRICSNYRGITLLSLPGNLFVITLLDRCTTFLRSQRRIQQAGFMPGRSAVDQIFIMRQLIEKTREFQQKAYVAFVDFKVAFDSVDRQSLWLTLKTTGLPAKYCNLFELLDEGLRARCKSMAGVAHLLKSILESVRTVLLIHRRSSQKPYRSLLMKL